MLRSKKFIISILLAVVVLAGSLGGVALAQEGADSEGWPGNLLERITAVLVDNGVNITSEQLQDAFGQVTGELRTEAMESRLQAMVEAGVITQEEANQYHEWLESEPEVSAGSQLRFRNCNGFPGMHGSTARNGFPGARRMQGFCAPPALPTE